MLNRGNGRMRISHTAEDFAAFEGVLAKRGGGHLYHGRFKSFPVA